MPKMRSALVAIAIVTLALGAPACKKKPVETTPVETPEPAPEPTPAPAPVREEVKEPDFQTQPPAEPAPTAVDINRQGHLKTIYFEFDQFELSEASRRTLQANAEWLKANREWNAVIEGHCDERGTIEYNLALGERRARAVQEYMVSLGLSASRMRILSYGEERPKEQGHRESAWAKNRRAEFVAE